MDRSNALNTERLPTKTHSSPTCVRVRNPTTVCSTQRIAVYIYGAGSSVTRGCEAVKGGISLDMSTHMNRVVQFNEIDQTITVEAGMTGPQLEEL
ncbi:MAG: FAD-binding oxidoreductase, partial [Myxococcales bacterium]